MQCGKAQLHQPYHVTKDKAQIKQWLQLQTEVRRHHWRMLEIDLFALEGTQTATGCKQQRGGASPELQALVGAQVKSKNDTFKKCSRKKDGFVWP